MNQRLRHHSAHEGFTLIEVLVALTIMAIIAALTWRGIDTISRAQSSSRQLTDTTLALQAGLTQWRNDLDSIVSWPTPTGIQSRTYPLTTARSMVWDGNSMLLTRSDPSRPADGLRVIAWTIQSSSGWWMRWQSSPFTTIDGWTLAWDQANRWAQAVNAGQTATASDPGQQAVLIVRATNWQLYYFRNNAWSNPLSSVGQNGQSANPVSTGDAAATLPAGVRLLLTVAPEQGYTGLLSVDWVRPTFTGYGL